MRSTATVTLLVSHLALAIALPQPYPQDLTLSLDPIPLPTTIIADPTISIPLSTSLNVPTTVVPTLVPTLSVPGNLSSWRSTSRHHYSHWEPIPIFSSACNCPKLATVQYPCWATDSLQRCNFEELHSFICWTSAARGCPTPTRKCSNLYAPTPLTGKHPCDLGQNTGGLEPAPTTAWVTEAPGLTLTGVPETTGTVAPSGTATLMPVGR